MILYRPVSLQEMALIYDSGMRAFPAHLDQQPIFYPVLQLAYARQTASDWNVQHGEFAGYVTQFKVEDEYISDFEEHTVGGTPYQELWIPTESMEEFNSHIVGQIKVLEAYFGEAFKGFVPDAFGLQGKNAVEQFTLLTNSFLYKRLDFYLELKRNHKAVFLNYPFWQKYEFQNPGLKGKILQAIKEAWFTSFPKIPLPNPLPEEAAPVERTQAHAPSSVDDDDEDAAPAKETRSPASANPVHEEMQHVRRSYADSLIRPIQEETTRAQEPELHRLVDPVHEEPGRAAQAEPDFVQGIQLGLSGKYYEAIAALTAAVEKNPDHVVAHTSLGVAFHRLGEDDRALGCYETALRIDPIHAEAHYFRANILYERRNVREAIAGYTLAIGLNPELIEAHEHSSPQDRLTDYTSSLAEMVWIARPAHRILSLNRSLETDPQQAGVFKERAAAYDRLQNYVQAIADYTAALEIEPEDALVLHARGRAYEQLGRFERALEDYQRAIAIDPQLSDVYTQRGIAFGKMGNFRQSIASFSESIRLAPGNPDGYFNRGTAYLQQGDFESAIADFSNVIRLSPKQESAYYRRGFSHEEAGHRREAIADFRQFLSLSTDPEARLEVEQLLSAWQQETLEAVPGRGVLPADQRWAHRSATHESDAALDLYGLIGALGERALASLWFGSDVNCHGEKAPQLHAWIESNQPIEGGDLLSIASGIRQTTQGDFYALDPGAAAHWLFIRAWDGSGFYIEIDDPNLVDRLKTDLPSLEEVDGAAHPYQGFFIRVE